MTLCCLSIKFTVIYQCQKPMSAPHLSLFSCHGQSNLFFFFLLPVFQYICMSPPSTWLQLRHPSLLTRIRASGLQFFLPTPQIPSQHSQCPAFYWVPIALEIAWHLKPFLSWILAQHSSSSPHSFQCCCHTYLPFLNALFIPCAFSDIHTVWVALAPLPLPDSASRPLGLILEPFPLGNLCLNHPTITLRLSSFIGASIASVHSS